MICHAMLRRSDAAMTLSKLLSGVLRKTESISSIAASMAAVAARQPASTAGSLGVLWGGTCAVAVMGDDAIAVI